MLYTVCKVERFVLTVIKGRLLLLLLHVDLVDDDDNSFHLLPVDPLFLPRIGSVLSTRNFAVADMLSGTVCQQTFARHPSLCSLSPGPQKHVY